MSTKVQSSREPQNRNQAVGACRNCEAAIATQNLTKSYGDVLAVDNLDLLVPKGELFALLGVNGAGKTTTIKMLTCLAKPTSGDALVGGLSVLTAREGVKRLIGVSPQETAIAGNLTVRENLELMGGVHGMDRAEVRARVSELSAQFGLGPWEKRRAGALSGGWQRRLSLAMALINEPQVLFLDEPTLGLDVLARNALWDVIRSLKGKATIVLTTHYMEEADVLADRVGVMDAGRLLACDTPQVLMERTQTSSIEKAFLAIVKDGAR